MRLAPNRSGLHRSVLLGSLIVGLPALAAAQTAPGTTGAPPSPPPAATTTTTTEREATHVDEPTEYRFEFGLTAGAHFFNKKSGLGRFTNSPADISPATNVAFGGRLAFNFNRWVSVEAEAIGIPTHTRNEATKMWAFGYRGSLIIHLVDTGPFRPFISLGYGGISTVVNNTAIVPSDTDSMLQGGVGFKIAMGEHAGLRIEGRILAPPAFLGKSVPVGNETGYDGPDYEALGGLYINFGEVEVERTKETIVKREVVMMPPPVSPDPDGDGIAGDADKCPNLAEDKDGFEDEDGCPDPDNDKDGIPDALDKCPNQPETVNGIDDEDGCPEIDADGDGILGSRDKCPDEPETVNGYKDDDGCPDEVPVAIKKFTGVIEGINFKTGQANILPGSYAILDRAVVVLKEYPDIRLEISGHTDSIGKADYNRDLSQRRADAVKTYFIANGVDAARLSSIGYGLDRPVADNQTESGRSKNRRTEFRLLMGDEGKPPRGDSGPPPANPAAGNSGPPPLTRP
jgi:OmpA-OmpF porin, OOP family